MRQVLRITHYEMVHILKDRLLFSLIFAVPLFYAFLLGSVYIAGILTDIPVGVVNLDHSKLSREVITAFENSPSFKIINEIDTYPQLEQAMRDGTVRAGIVIPEEFEKKVSQHRETALLTIYDGSNLVWGFNIRKYAQEVITNFNSSHTKAYLAGLGLTEQEIIAVMDTVALNYEVWYNPTFSYATFIFMSLVMMIIHQIGLLSIGLTITREKEQNSWLQYICAPIPRWKIFLGKAIPYFTANLFNYCLLIWFSARFIHTKIGSSPSLMLLLGLPYILIIVSAGFYISVRAANSLQVTRYLMLLSVPFFIISGCSWPPSHIPDWVNSLARLLPFTWMAEGFRLVTLKELGLNHIGTNLLVLFLMAALSIFLALSFDKRRKPPQDNGLEIHSGPSYPQRF